jgi:peptidoglycan hydrolase CwlO-like protein
MKKAEETVKAMITEEQLKLLQEQQSKLNEMLRTVGVLEVQKSNVSKEIEALSKEIDSTKKELEEEYGQININLQDGSYEDIVEEDAK